MLLTHPPLRLPLSLPLPLPLHLLLTFLPSILHYRLLNRCMLHTSTRIKICQIITWMNVRTVLTLGTIPLYRNLFTYLTIEIIRTQQPIRYFKIRRMFRLKYKKFKIISTIFVEIPEVDLNRENLLLWNLKNVLKANRIF